MKMGRYGRDVDIKRGKEKGNMKVIIKMGIYGRVVDIKKDC